MKKNKTKLKNIFLIIFASLAIILSIGMIGLATDGFKTTQDMSLTTVNPDNLIQVDEFTVKEIEDDKTFGYTLEISKNGEIVIEGENETESDAKIAVQKVSLQAKEYTITSNANCDDKTYFVTLENDEGSVKIEADDTFEIETAGEYTVYINICKGEKIDDSFEIVLVEGDKEAPFFVLK